MLRFIYNILIIVMLPLIMLVLMLKYRTRFAKYFFTNLDQRFGKLNLPDECTKKPVIWLHASSVGELNMLKPLIAELRSTFLSHTIYLSTVTPEAVEEAKKIKLADFIFIAPLDIHFVARRVVRKIRPSLLLLAESEFWPNLIVEAKKIGTMVGVVNTRISDSSYKWMRYMKWWYRYILSYIDFFCIREKEDLNRILSLGIKKDRVKFTGNIKYDAVNLPAFMPEQIGEIYKKYYMMPEHFIFVCGSIHLKETRPIIRAFTEALRKYPTMKLILAPRHIEKAGEVAQMLKKNNISFRLHSKSGCDGENPLATCVILDTVGDLISAYRIATIVFVGGSLVPKGGQNIIEPALLEKPILFGPFMHNFKSSSQELLRCGGAVQIGNARELTAQLFDLLSDKTHRLSVGRRALSAASSLKGATMSTMSFIKKWYA